MSLPDDADRYLSLPDLSEYSGLSVSTLKRHLAGSAPIPHFKLGSRVLVRRSEFDTWLATVATPPHVADARTHADDVRRAADGILGRSDPLTRHR